MGRILERLVGDLSDGSGANFKNRVIKPGLAIVLGSAVLGWAANSEPSEYERATEECVGALVGHSVDLVAADASGALQHPREVIDEQMACGRNNNDPQVAVNDIRHVPLADHTAEN